jgi:hypothetical protein
VLAEFFRDADPEAIVGVARWTGTGAGVEAEDPKVRRALGRIFRPTAVLVDDPALRSFGTHGPELIPPGSVRWFMACARARAAAEKLSYRLAPSPSGMGWDPAGVYGTFPARVERREQQGHGL